MERNTEYKKIADADVKKTTTTTTPEDGFVDQREIRPRDLELINRDAVRKYHKGHSTTVSYETNDPRITRLVTWAFTGIFAFIGVLLLLTRSFIFGFAFVAMAIAVYRISKRDIDEIAKKKEAEGLDVTIDSVEEAKEIATEFLGEIKDATAEAVDTTITNYQKNKKS